MWGELEYQLGCRGDGSSPPAAAGFYIPCMLRQPVPFPGQQNLWQRARTLSVCERGAREERRNPPPHPQTPPLALLPGEKHRLLLFLRRFPRHEGREMPHPGRECSSRNRNAIVSKRASMSLHLPGSNPCRLFPGGTPTPAPRGGQEPE